MSAEHFDIAVIGGGSAGLTVAAAAAQFGQRVVLFEKAEMGGDCLNTGCVPSKALLAAAKHAAAIRQAAAFGITAGEPVIDFGKVMDHVARTIAAIAPHDSVERFTGLGVTVISAAARFRDDETLEADGRTFTARRIVIATGSRAAVPPIPGLEQVSYFTNETLFRNRELPGHLLVIGGGPIGLEMAQAFRRLGSAVTVVEAAEPLAKDDPELSAVVLAALEAEGIRILRRTAIRSLSPLATGLRADTSAGPIEATHLLVAAGRRPNIETLGLEAAGIAFTARGITVDQGLRTSNRRVYAIGDVAGGPQFTHAAGYHGGLVVRNALFGLPAKAIAPIPWVTYTDPELAHVGLTEAEARQRFDDEVKVLRWPFRDNDRAQADGDTAGFVKAVVGRRGRVLGASIVGAGAGELILPWVQAVAGAQKIGRFVSAVIPYPTRSEATRRAALTHYANFATNRLVRSVIGLVKRLNP